MKKIYKKNFTLAVLCGMLIMQLIFMEAVLKKQTVLYHLVWLWLVPFLLITLFTSISSYATLMYEYLPKPLDVILQVTFFDAASYLLEFVLFFCVGGFCLAVYNKKVFSSVACAAIALLHAGLLPMILFFVRSLFLSAISTAEEMNEYWNYDVFTAQSNFSRVLSALAIACVVAIIFNLSGKKDRFAKPYITFRNEPAVAAFVMACILEIFSVISFFLLGDYDYIALAVQTLYAALGFFVIVLGAYSMKKNYEKE